MTKKIKISNKIFVNNIKKIIIIIPEVFLENSKMIKIGIKTPQ